MFSRDFGDQISFYTTLVDPNNNEFQVLVERFNGSKFLTKGWQALLDFYANCFGAWVTMPLWDWVDLGLILRIGLAERSVILNLILL